MCLILKQKMFLNMISTSQPPGSPLLASAQASDGSPGEMSCLLSPLFKRKGKTGTKKSYRVSEEILKEKKGESAGLGFQERQTVISKCFFALSGCLTKAAGEFYSRIRPVAFLWLLTSGGFGLAKKSQWSNGHVCRFCGTVYWLWFRKQCFFFLEKGLLMLWFIIFHLWLQFDVLYCYHHFGSTAEECVWGFTWAHGKKQRLF